MYTRNWYNKLQERRVFSRSRIETSGDVFRYIGIQCIGFNEGYEFGYSLGIL